MGGIRDARLDNVEEGGEEVFVDIIEVPRITAHGALVAENVVPVIRELTTGTEGGDKVLGHMDPKVAVGSKLLLA